MGITGTDVQLSFKIVAENEVNNTQSTSIPAFDLSTAVNPMNHIYHLEPFRDESFDTDPMLLFDSHQDYSPLDARISEARKVLLANSGPYGSMKVAQVNENTNEKIYDENISRISHIIKASKVAITTIGKVIKLDHLIFRGANRIKTKISQHKNTKTINHQYSQIPPKER